MFTFFLLLARFLEIRSRQRAGFAAAGLLGQLPDVATRLGESGQPEQIPLGRLQAGDRVLVRVGQTIPADGRVLSGQGQIDESTLTGESLAVHRAPGDAVTAGTINVDGVLEIEVTATGAQKRIPPDRFEIMLRATKDLRASGIMDGVLKVGDRLPDFELKNAEGDNVRSSELLSQGAVVLTVFRGSW